MYDFKYYPKQRETAGEIFVRKYVSPKIDCRLYIYFLCVDKDGWFNSQRDLSDPLACLR